jgi:lysozyme family protein
VTTDAIIDDVIRREGGYVDHPADKGGPTKYGITLGTLARWRRAAVTAADVQALTVREAHAIYTEEYVMRPRFHLVTDDRLRALLVDWGVHSGPTTAIRGLQAVLGVTGAAVLGPQTVAALQARPAAWVYAGVVRARGQHLARLLQRDPSQRVFAAGWINRLMEFV